jgi:phospholipid N-methyltransferase
MNLRTTVRPSRPPAARALFLRGFLKRPGMVASVVPSSAKLIRRMLAPVDWANCRLFVEYGPGVGTFTRPVLDRLDPDARLIAIDTNPDFIAHLNRSIDDPRFIAVLGSAADVDAIITARGHAVADYVLSGLPFTNLPPGIGDRIAGETWKILRPGGAFLVYQFNPRVRDFLRPHFARIDHALEWWNVPPAQLFWAWKD